MRKFIQVYGRNKSWYWGIIICIPTIHKLIVKYIVLKRYLQCFFNCCKNSNGHFCRVCLNTYNHRECHQKIPAMSMLTNQFQRLSVCVPQGTILKQSGEHTDPPFDFILTFLWVVWGIIIGLHLNLQVVTCQLNGRIPIPSSNIKGLDNIIQP